MCIRDSSDVPDESLEDKNESADEEIEGSVGSFSCYGEENMTGTSILAPNYIPHLVSHVMISYHDFGINNS